MDISNLVTGTIDEIVDCIDCAVNTILARRELFPRKDFRCVKKYNVALLKTNNVQLKAYIEQALNKLRIYLSKFLISTFVVAIKDSNTKSVLERWRFLIKVDNPQQPMSAHPYKRVQEQLSNVLKYIHISADRMGKLQMQCSFKILLHQNVTSLPLNVR